MTAEEFIKLLLTFAVSITGGLIGKKLRLPACYMVGGILAVAVFNVATGLAYFPEQYTFILQFISGIYIGHKVFRNDIKELITHPLILIILVLWMMLVNAIVGLAIHWLAGFDIPTAMFSCAPGGMNDMALIAKDLGGDITYVALIQLSRVIFITALYPFIYRFIFRKNLYPKVKNSPKESSTAGSVSKRREFTKKEKILYTVITAAFSVAGGTLFRELGVAGGATIGALVFVALFNCITAKAYSPPALNILTQILCGVLIGARITRNDVANFDKLLLPVLIVAVSGLLSAYLVAVIVSKIVRTDFMTSLLMSTPGGIQEMTILADEFQCDTPRVVLVQTLRIILVILLFPGYLGMLVRFFS